MSEGFSRVARTVRGSWTENTHFGVAVVTTPDGRIVGSLGDSERRVFLRSAAKPLQLLPLLVAGGRERFSLSQAEIALMCSSHAGSDEHVRAVRGLLDRNGILEESLTCGIHPPLGQEAATALREQGESPSRLHNNCSANHVGQLMACLLLNSPTEGYSEMGHPLQQKVLGLVAEFAGIETEEIQTGVDGCGLPSFRVATAQAARLYACLADPKAGGVAEDLVPHSRAVIEAMAAHPDMVAGPGRFTTELIRVTGGRLIGKEGAEGFYGVAVRGPVALGIAIKIADGTEECRDAVVIELLRQAGCLSLAEFEQLSPFYGKELRNHEGEAVGELAPDLELVQSEIWDTNEPRPAERAG
ncbi:MAG: asparaginase [bacterium]|nr:asparaginase [bacterium]